MINRPIVVHDFLPAYKEFNEYVRELEYSGEVNPYDGVEYPGINTQIPDFVQDKIAEKVGIVVGEEVKASVIFLRLNTKDIKKTAPHQAHEDTVMGQYTFILYLGEGVGGTSFVRHRESGISTTPVDQYEADIWKRDTNVPEAWVVDKMVDHAPNKAVIFPSYMMHRAEPIEGFGTSPEDGRLVMVGFFSAVS